MSAFGVGSGSEIDRWFVALDAKIDDLDAGLAAAQQATANAVGSMQSTARFGSSAFARFGRRAGTAMLGLASAIAKVTIGLGVAAKAATDLSARADRRLSRSLEMAGESSAAAAADFDAFARTISSTTTLSTNQVKELGAQIATLAGVTGTELQSASNAAIGLAARFEHMGLTTKQAGKLVTDAIQGSFSGVERYGIQLDETADAQGRLNQLLGIARSGLDDARDAANTTAGRIQRLKGAISDMFTELGRAAGLADGGGFLEVAIQAVEALTVAINRIAPAVATAVSAFKTFADITSDLIGFEMVIAKLQNFFDRVTTLIAIALRQIEELGGGRSFTEREMLGMLRADERPAAGRVREARKAQQEREKKIAAAIDSLTIGGIGSRAKSDGGSHELQTVQTALGAAKVRNDEQIQLQKLALRAQQQIERNTRRSNRRVV